MKTVKIKDIEKAFAVSKTGLGRIMKDFRLEMDRGLRAEKSSLKMIPTYVGRPTGREKGRFMALDIGGTNFRVLDIELKGNGVTGEPRIMKFVIPKKHITGTAEGLFGFIAGCIKEFIDRYGIGASGLDLGFTFSFPVRQTGIAAGSLICWTKGFNAKGVVGKDVVALMNEALGRSGIRNIKIAALANDTVGTMVARSYGDRDCDVGVIIGTGTNACYGDKMIINIEWGNFNKLKSNPYDRRLDRASDRPGEQILEKMVSGMYLGTLAALGLEGLGYRMKRKREFLAEYMSLVESDRSPGLRKVKAILESLGMYRTGIEDRRACKRICEIVSRRASRISAACIAAIVKKIDPQVSRPHTIALDGALYEKHPTFAKNMRLSLKEIFGRKASFINMALARDGSGKGAAIIAAVAETRT